MQEFLIVVDMQKDFINGALGSPEAETIVPRIREKLKHFSGKVLFTRDTHTQNYAETQEGRNLPVPHCIKGTDGWQISGELSEWADDVTDKPTFGSVALAERLRDLNDQTPIHRITLVGLCTDICVISNAMLLKAFLPETEICVDAACCAGVTPESHQTALNAMKMCQITVENRP